MIRVIVEYNSIKDFEAWSGGEDTLNIIRDYDKMDELEELAEITFDDKLIDEDVLNCWLWFDRDEILAELGIEE